MTKESFDRLLKTKPGIGVKATTSFGTELLFFYEDFDGPGTGIQRAMQQMYHGMEIGKYTGLVFVEGEGSRKEG